MKHQRSRASRVARVGIATVATLAALVAMPTGASASTAPGLGTAGSYAVLAGTPAVSSTGTTIISGSVGISPAASITGFPPGVVSNGTLQGGTAAAGIAKNDLTTAYGVAAASPCNSDKTGQNLGGMTLTPGTYCQTTAPTLTGILTLSGAGVYIFQSASTLVTAPGASVILTNGAQACNVYWQVSSSATIDTTTTFAGTILALTDITINSGATISGRALARNGLVSMIDDAITVPTGCAATATTTPTSTPINVSPRVPRTGAASPERPSLTIGSLLMGLGLMVFVLSRSRSPIARRRRSPLPFLAGPRVAGLTATSTESACPNATSDRHAEQPRDR